MKKEYKAPFCKVVEVEKKDILTLSTTKNYVKATKNDTQGDFGASSYGGSYIGWNSWS